LTGKFERWDATALTVNPKKRGEAAVGLRMN
jgi:hypothetical protein